MSVARPAKNFVDIPDPASDALLLARMISTNKWRAIVANLAHAGKGSPIDLIMGTQLMMEIGKITRGIYVGFPQDDSNTVILNMTRGREHEPVPLSLLDGIAP